ncbi:Ecm25p SCDLUD_004041 [Saccharomycodes ludwigii]|uniref:Ecm25p n=1 Tax=Saccharomycodes ludwigii TaxID=36035 RepID=UPI001E81C8CF|nr:hypothetical protein SCDLUD_004041 [Saccharomycodes ludwigii]KAH3899754.1 hypothetical protein SCDLUD_004041 [Saccharomycodes ludwigii]
MSYINSYSKSGNNIGENRNITKKPSLLNLNDQYNNITQKKKKNISAADHRLTNCDTSNEHTFSNNNKKRIDININNIFYQSYAYDNNNNLIYVFDSTYLPSYDLIGDKAVFDLLMDKITDKLISKLPDTPYSLVAFTSGFGKNNISWIYGIKMYSKLPQHSKNYLQRLYIVHESFWVRTVYQVFKNAMNIKFLNNNPINLATGTVGGNEVIIEYVSDLSQLSLQKNIDITKLRISLNVYLHDYSIKECIDIPTKYLRSKNDILNRQYRQSMFDKIFNKLKLESIKYELVFTKPGNFRKINILLGVIERNNYVDLSQWDIYSLATVFLNFIKNKSKPFFPIDMITLPISDDLEYTLNIFQKMVEFNDYYMLIVVIFPIFLNLLKHQNVTKHTYHTLSKSLVTTFCKEKVSIKSENRLAIGKRFIKNVLIHFENIRVEMDSSMQTGNVGDTVGNNLVLKKKSNNGSSSSISSIPPDIPKPRKNRTGSIGHSENVSPIKNLTPPPSRSFSPKPSISALPKVVLLPKASETSRLTSSFSICSPDKNLRQKANDKSMAPIGNNEESGQAIMVTNADDERITEKPIDMELVTVDKEKDRQMIKTLQLQSNETIQNFDKMLQQQKQKMTKVKVNQTNKFSTKGYGDLKEGNKVSRLAALYEERIQGLNIINDIKTHQQYRGK